MSKTSDFDTEKDPEKVSISSDRESLRDEREVYGKYAQEELFDPEKDTLHRGLSARQISMIALGGAIGTGLIIGSGTALVRGGPLGLFLGYTFVGLVMIALGEMSAYLPHKKGFPGYATRFVDPAFGFALGWNYLLKYLIATPNNINAAGVVIQYWNQRVHVAVWMVIFIVFIFVVNLLGVRVFGELEFWFSSIKVITLVGLILMGIVIDLGGNPQHDRIGFRYWDHPYGPMGTYLNGQVHNYHLSIFLGFWATLVNALFAFIGTELIGVTVGEAQAPRKNIPIAIRRTFFRIVVFYIGSVFVIGMIVPSTTNAIFVANKSKAGAAASPFVVATSLVGIKVLNHIINACILLFVLSAANSDLYIATRTLYGLAVERKAPRIFSRVNRMGVPYPSLILAILFCGLVFLNVSSSSAKVFTWFVNLVSTFGAITWMCICYTHIRFMRALKVQGFSRDDLPYKAPFQPFGSWFALIATAIITLFKGFDTFIPFTTDTFVTSYIALPAFVLFWAGYKLWYRTGVIPAEKVDLVTGKREIDEEEERFNQQEALKGPRTRWQKFLALPRKQCLRVVVSVVLTRLKSVRTRGLCAPKFPNRQYVPALFVGHLIERAYFISRNKHVLPISTLFRSMYKALCVAALAAVFAYFYTPTLYQNYFAPEELNTPSILDSAYNASEMAMASISRTVVQKVLSVETPEGAGALVRRSIGSMKLRNLSPFLMLDHFHVSQGAGFPDHPHRGQATVTYMLEGKSQHEDSAGHKGTIEAGGVQWMCAGRGIIHAEMPVHAAGLPDPRGLQLWVDLPKQFKMVEPSYQELEPNEIPTAYPEGPDGPVKIKVISGKSHGIESPVRPLGGCWYFHVIFDKKATIFQPIPEGWTAFAYVLKGSVSVGDKAELPHEAFHTLVLSSDPKETGVKLTAGQDKTEFVLIAGEPLDQPVMQYGPFVMTSKEEIIETLQDYRDGRNGFEKAHTWKSIIGNR
ncbi:hypothetical protein NM688_g2879 [Phlebia brevispora]|uniref:Uncharacterized protein n=1 Tax=Phlebia brevispora TaxID=194682 RepID=A0ACC1T7R0_9APHY|nr:hypothetical protein NM688_g2879 [Phlebia brevispora]